MGASVRSRSKNRSIRNVCRASPRMRSEERRVGKDCRGGWATESRRRHTRYIGDWSSDVCSSDLIKARVANLDIAMTQDRQAATTIVQLLRERDFYPTLRKAYGRKRTLEIQKSLDPQCLSGFAKDEIGRASCRERL